MRTFLVLVAVALSLIFVAAAYVWWGGYNVAANVPHRSITLSFLKTVRERSIHRHSNGLSIPSFNDPKLAEGGFPHYHAMCRLCHGAPGYPANEFAKGLSPQPPDLASKDIQSLKDRELYWVTKNGIKMTGMPAFSYTHSEEEILKIVAFLRHLPELTPETYKSWLRKAGMPGEEIPHHHR